MATSKPIKPFALTGRRAYRWRSLTTLTWAYAVTLLRRFFRGPLRPGWTADFETTMRFLKAQAAYADRLADIGDAREYEDSLLLYSPALEKVAVEDVGGPIQGRWFRPTTAERDGVVLYLHGGGFAFATRAHDTLAALLAVATDTRVLGLDYRLAPEHVFPAQLDDVLAGYRWLLANGIEPERIVLAGDSAGGNLTLALLLALRDAGDPLPVGAVCIVPWTDLANPGASMTANEHFDWIDKRMADRWAGWYARASSVDDPRVSPARADLRGLPPIYVQAGDAEILHDMIAAFAQRGREQGADVRLDVWPGMTHDFQFLGDLMGESREALDRIGRFVAERLERQTPG